MVQFAMEDAGEDDIDGEVSAVHCIYSSYCACTCTCIVYTIHIICAILV